MGEADVKAASDESHLCRCRGGGFNRARIYLPALLGMMIRLLKPSSAGPSYLLDVVTCGEEGLPVPGWLRGVRPAAWRRWSRWGPLSFLEQFVDVHLSFSPLQLGRDVEDDEFVESVLVV